MLGTIYCMIILQGSDNFTPSAQPYIPAMINGTWICLICLGVCVVLSTIAPGAGETVIGSPGASTPGRFAVVRDLPKLGTDRRNIENAWGSPEPRDDQSLVYKTNGGLVVFCLDGQGLTQKIIEAKEVNVDAVRTLCK